MQNIFIPKKIRVGFKNSDDTYTNKLAYIIYYDSKNKIRKEPSFLGWIDKSIPTIELENTPQAGFVFNKGVQHGNSFSYSTSKIRVHDHRNFEFEIDIGNLVEIMKHCNISHQEISEKCVFGWEGGNLILIPVNSSIYKNAVAFTQKINEPLNVKTFVAGQLFKNKNGDEMLYLGDFQATKIKKSSGYDNSIVKKKQSFFYNVKSKSYHECGKATMIERVVEETHPEFAAALENLQVGLHKWNFTKFDIQPISDEEFIKSMKDFFSTVSHFANIEKLEYSRNNIEFPSNIALKLYDNEKMYSFPRLQIFREHLQIDIQPYITVISQQDDVTSFKSGYQNRYNSGLKFTVSNVDLKNTDNMDNYIAELLKMMKAAGHQICKIGFVNSDGDYYSMEKLSFSMIDMWNYFNGWDTNKY